MEKRISAQTQPMQNTLGENGAPEYGQRKDDSRKNSLTARQAETDAFEIDRTLFGQFLARQRKELGFTQKELAQRLFVSDKAVSKWERGLSLPDITLLIPLAGILGVSVTELLEGRRLEEDDGMDSEHVEALVKKALTFSDETPEQAKARRRKHAVVFASAALLSVPELLAGIMLSVKADILALSSGFLTLELLSFAFGIYFWLFMKERLPGYYDENRISTYSDGIFTLNLTGNVRFNNSNWPHILKSLRIWSVTTMLAIPLICIVLSLFRPGLWWIFGIEMGVLAVYLGGLFVPLYIAAKKYE